jgi:hypothetical protein
MHKAYFAAVVDPKLKGLTGHEVYKSLAPTIAAIWKEVEKIGVTGDLGATAREGWQIPRDALPPHAGGLPRRVQGACAVGRSREGPPLPGRQGFAPTVVGRHNSMANGSTASTLGL